MTKKLYDDDAYAVGFTGSVVECFKENEMYKVVLDQTLFFPEEGGQSPDLGTLNGIPVKDVKIKGDEIFHYLESPIRVGEKVTGIIDFEHRFKNMQMHSGEHIFSGLVYKKYGFNNVGFHLSDNSATIDLDGKLTKEELRELEADVNRVIFQNVTIKAFYPSKEELSKTEYRSKKEIDGEVRLVLIEGADICACCAPHVHRTGEIGIFKITGFESYKGGIRINYLCGFRALSDYSERIDSLTEISHLLMVKSGEEADKVNSIFEENKDLKYKLFLLNNRIIENEIVNTFTGNENGVRVAPAEEASNMKYSMELMHKYYKGTCYLFCGDNENGYRYLIESVNEDLLELSKMLKEKFGAKGGGKKNSIQGSVIANIDDLLKIV